MSKSLQIAIQNSAHNENVNIWHPIYSIPKVEISCDDNFRLLINCLDNNSNNINNINNINDKKSEFT